MGEDSNDSTCTTRISKVAIIEIGSFQKQLKAQEGRNVSFVEASRRIFENQVRPDMPVNQALKNIGKWPFGRKR